MFFLTLLLAMLLHRCQNEKLPPASTLPSAQPGKPFNEEPLDSIKPPATETTLTKNPTPITTNTASHPKLAEQIPAQLRVAPGDSGPYIYADPWGGRHFDSVRVALHCREECLILYSLEDSVHFKSYETPFTFRRNTTLWLSGIDSLRRQVAPIRVEYVIERNPGACSENSMPVEVNGKSVCMDVFEWPNREGAFPSTFVNQQEASDSCKHAHKRLCTEEEWRTTCQGPDKATYPYGNKYNENYCPAKEAAVTRSGRFPVCRSYYGVYDQTGNLWEWTSTPSKSDSDFFLVAGGNWDSGNEGTCSLAKFSFYPSVRYPFVGFRCCQNVTGK